MSSGQKDLYAILGLNQNAEPAVIKAAYKALIMIYHPDKYVGDKEQAIQMSKEINEAYKVLITPDRRKNYDMAQLVKSIKTSNTSNTSEYSKIVHNELKKTIKESEAILNILNDFD